MFKPQQHHLQIERLILQNGGIAKRLGDGFYEQKLVHANNDLNNLGGTIDASNSLIASAGHDLNVISSTSTQSNATSSRTNISRVAGLYVTGDQGLLVASAGNDLHLDAAQIINNGKDSSTKLRAGHDLTIGTVASGQQSQITSNSKNKLSENSSQDHGSTIQTAGDISLQAGQDVLSACPLQLCN